ncbi:MAG: PAS domain-containing methyl-accepting chemotaxis protein [Rickettsiales bacterium]|nr:PAS domain-containing methyl-accepting chemotaxis protein [Rickettsiales bacterium]
MFSKKDSSLEAKYAALNHSTAIIEFLPNGTILDANENFLSATGYSLSEIAGQHHRIFVSDAYARSKDYSDFWERLARGETFSASYQRFAKGGKEIWIQASYNPIKDTSGKVKRIIKFASDITAAKQKQIDEEGQLNGLRTLQAVIEFTPEGTILNANTNFLSAMGYSLNEITGQHHRLFVLPEYAASPEYKKFWADLASGKQFNAEFQRFAKGNKEVWIQASYIPIPNVEGKIFKVVKYAVDITAQKLKAADSNGQITALHRSQAVIEFQIDGTIITANDNFLSTMGYSLEEVRGKHHSMFAPGDYAQSQEYKQFWEKLRSGQFFASEYPRIGKGGKEVWIQASYNPILDMNGKVFKVVKFATDITAMMQARKQSGDLSGELLSSIQSAAAAAEELSASIGDISKNMASSSQAVQDISGLMQKTSVSMSSLQQTSRSMETVVELIRSIAGQVNLLALNATIEAARAGDAGKGFAVVAAEVKTLASQVGKATDEIAEKIAELQTMSTQAADSANQVNASTGAVNESISSVASAIEEQSAVTKEISMNMQKASSGVNALGQCIDQIAGRK